MNPSRLKRIAMAVLFTVLAWASLSGHFDHRGHVTVDAGLERSLVAFGLARGINAIISVVQGSEVALQPAGLGLTLSVGEVLDPVNDLVERFSWVMLASSVSFAMQKFLLDFGAWPWFSISCAAAFLLAASSVLSRRSDIWRLRRAVLRGAVVLAIVRFAVPFAAISNEVVYDHLLQPRFESARSTIAGVHSELEALEQRHAGPAAGPSFDGADGWTDKVGRFFDTVAATVDVRANWERERAAYAASVARMTSSVIEMIAVFIIQTMVIPVLFVVVVWAGLKGALKARGVGS